MPDWWHVEREAPAVHQLAGLRDSTSHRVSRVPSASAGVPGGQRETHGTQLEWPPEWAAHGGALQCWHW